MADDKFKQTSTPSGADAKPKDEMARITLPPKPSDLPQEKREAVRINVPGKGAEAASSGGETEKSVRPHVSKGEISKAVAPPVKPPVGVSKPSVPPPVTKPPVATSPLMPTPPKSPLAGGSAPKPPLIPKPPTLGSKPVKLPATPLKPASSLSGETKPEAQPDVEPSAKSGKQMARIQVPPHSREDSRAPLKMELPKTMAATPPTVNEPVPKRGDFAMTGLAIAALLASALSLFLSYLAFTSA